MEGEGAAHSTFNNPLLEKNITTKPFFHGKGERQSWSEVKKRVRTEEGGHYYPNEGRSESSQWIESLQDTLAKREDLSLLGVGKEEEKNHTSCSKKRKREEKCKYGF